MFAQRLFVVLIALITTLATPLVARAAETTPQRAAAPASSPPLVGQPPNDIPRPLTAAERRQNQAKMEMAAQIERQAAPAGSSKTQSCPASASLRGSTSVTCTSTSKVLPMYARQQVNCSYCGPATGQVIINHSRGYRYTSVDGWSTTTNYRHQGTIASSMWTTSSGTTGGGMANGLNVLARRPSNFTYYYTAAGTGSQWHAKVITDIDGYNMGLAAALKPWEQGAAYRLSSWPAVAPGARHWIAIRGFAHLWDGTRRPLVYYSDSARYCGGGTGNYQDPSYDVHYMIQLNAGSIVW